MRPDHRGSVFVLVQATGRISGDLRQEMNRDKGA